MPMFLILLAASSCLAAVAKVLKAYGPGFHLVVGREHLFNRIELRRDALANVAVKLMLANWKLYKMRGHRKIL